MSGVASCPKRNRSTHIPTSEQDQRSLTPGSLRFAEKMNRDAKRPAAVCPRRKPSVRPRSPIRLRATGTPVPAEASSRLRGKACICTWRTSMLQSSGGGRHRPSAFCCVEGQDGRDWPMSEPGGRYQMDIQENREDHVAADWRRDPIQDNPRVASLVTLDGVDPGRHVSLQGVVSVTAQLQRQTRRHSGG